MNTIERPGQLPRHTSTAALNRRAKLLDEAEAAGDLVVEAARVWLAWRDVPGEVGRVAAEHELAAAVRDLNAKLARAERAR